MIITIKNPIDNTDVDIEVQVSTNLITYSNGNQELSLTASGSVILNETDE